MKRFAALSVFATIALISCGLACAQAQQVAPGSVLRAKVVAYASATAFAVLDPTDKLARVKLTGVDAPERRQRFALEARRLASEWLGRAPVDVSIDGRGKDERWHGRIRVDERDVGLTLIEAGLAWCDPADEAMLPDSTREAYRSACAQAKTNRRGLWADANPTPPWEYRKVPEFDPMPTPKRSFQKTCRDIGYQTVQCDDGTRYRIVGDDIYGDDGTVYARRGHTISGDDGSRYTQQGTSTYGIDGSVCRSRGRQTRCY